jgi:molybdate transport system substrate-binding protein
VTKTVRVLSGGAAAAVVSGVQPQFEKDCAARVEGTFNAVGQMRDQLLAGEACDLVILSRSLIDQLVASGHVVAGSQRSLGRVKTGVAVNAGTPHVAIATRDQLATALRNAGEIYCPDPQKATAGIHFMNVLKMLGLDSHPGLRTFPNGATAMAAMAQSTRNDAIGCTQETEINYTAGVELVGSLPAEFELATDYVLGVCTQAAQPELAQRLAELVAGPASAQIRRQGGFRF